MERLRPPSGWSTGLRGHAKMRTGCGASGNGLDRRAASFVSRVKVTGRREGHGLG
jgi:hypothetical protein